MTQIYSDPKRETDPHALPDVEVFYVDENDVLFVETPESVSGGVGWYWWPCFPGCLPDSDPIGPFDTEEAAIKDAQNID